MDRRAFRHFQGGANADYCFSVSGGKAIRLSKVFTPTNEEVIQMLLEVRHESGLSRPAFATILGVPVNTIRAWETGLRNPCSGAKRLIWILHCTFFDHSLKDMGAWVTWSRAEVPKTEPETGTKSQVKAEPKPDLPKSQ